MILWRQLIIQQKNYRWVMQPMVQLQGRPCQVVCRSKTTTNSLTVRLCQRMRSSPRAVSQARRKTKGWVFSIRRGSILLTPLLRFLRSFIVSEQALPGVFV